MRSAAPRGSLSNAALADALARIADLLETQDSDGFRVRAYRRGAERVRKTPESVAALNARGGVAALDALPEGMGIGRTSCVLG
jgi:DNA polymerase/3'-5' exonuclease PolX